LRTFFFWKVGKKKIEKNLGPRGKKQEDFGALDRLRHLLNQLNASSPDSSIFKVKSWEK